MVEWYIAPYYDSKEQYLYGYCEDFSGRKHLYNFGEVIDVAVEKRIKKQRAVYSCCITTTDRAYDCPFFLMRSGAVSPQGLAMIDYWDEIRDSRKLDTGEREVKWRDTFVVGVDMESDAFVKAAAMYSNDVTVDSGLHYFVRIESGQVREIRPENATYMTKQMIEMNEKQME